MPLTTKQRLFCELYAANGGNGKQAAIGAGYSEKSAAESASENLRNSNVLQYIRELAEPAQNNRVANATEIKEFWTAMMRNEKEKSTERLVASEKLAKSAAMFTDRIEHSGSVQMPVVIEVVGV